jgi:hypothetical protein
VICYESSRVAYAATAASISSSVWNWLLTKYVRNGLILDVGSPHMPVARITVTAVSDEGDTVIVWGRPENAPNDSEQADVGLAERASRLARGTEAAIDYTSIAGDWNLARGLSAS